MLMLGRELEPSELKRVAFTKRRSPFLRREPSKVWRVLGQGRDGPWLGNLYGLVATVTLLHFEVL